MNKIIGREKINTQFFLLELSNIICHLKVSTLLELYIIYIIS